MVLNNRKALKLVVCMSLIVALAISVWGFSVWATFENTNYNSGDQAADIVNVAQTQVGYAEGYNSYTKYGDWYGLPNSDWCAMFVSWCANQAGVDNDVFPSFALCSAGADWFISQGRFHYSGSYAPQAGDLIFYSSYGNIYHVGLVTGSDGSNVYSIEGNYNEMVSNVSYPLSYGDILGYATPAYSTESDDAVVEEEPENSEIIETVLTNETPQASTDEEDSDIVSGNDTSVDEDSDITEDSDSSKDSDIAEDSDSSKDSDIAEDSDEEASENDEKDVTADTDSEEVSDTDFDSGSDSDSDSDEKDDSDIESDAQTDDSDTDSDEEAISEDTTITVVLLGDVNDDGEVDVLDSLLVQRYLVLSLDDEINVLNADVNNSGSIDIGDALVILKMVVGLA